MASARQRAGGVLDSYSAVRGAGAEGREPNLSLPLHGVDATAAASACGQLKKLQIDCFVVKAE